jgi:hypothetical protein
MAEDYRSMWSGLGLDLEAHDALLGVLGQAYQDIYLAQENRPEGMGYFDFVMSEVHGLRIKELLDEKAAGRKIIGSYCVFVPEEIVLAANATLVGLCSGADFATEEVEKLLPRNTCALIKSSFGFKLGKVCPYLESADMIVGENTCDGKKKAYESLDDLVENLYVMDLPQVKSENGKALLKAEYARFKEAVEELTGVSVTPESLKGGDPHGQRQKSGYSPPGSIAQGQPRAHIRSGRPFGQPGFLLRQPGPLYGIREQNL